MRWQGQPGTASGQQDQRDARRQELRDSEAEATASRPDGLTAGATHRGHAGPNSRPEILRRLAILERLRLCQHLAQLAECGEALPAGREMCLEARDLRAVLRDRKSTRLNSSH